MLTGACVWCAEESGFISEGQREAYVSSGLRQELEDNSTLQPRTALASHGHDGSQRTGAVPCSVLQTPSTILASETAGLQSPVGKYTHSHRVS